MQQLNEHHSFTGMQRDMTISKHPSSFLYDAHNIRLTARGEDTLLTITNEKGPRDTGITVNGAYLGHCLLGNYLVVFSTTYSEESVTIAKANSNARYIQSLERNTLIEDETDSDNKGTLQPYLPPDTIIDDPILPWGPLDQLDPLVPDDGGDDNTDVVKYDYITRIDLSSGETVILYNGNLNFSTQYPIEAIASYENNNIQKIYWTDGYNQPRVINIVGTIIENLDSQFDFVRELQLKEKVTIQKQLGAAGSFAPGVLQYAFTYFSKYGQESNIFYTSPLLYTSYKDRGGSPEDKVENAFKITVSNLDKNFDYLRIYSIQRTSVNGTPIVKRVQDIGIKDLTPNVTSKSYVTSSSLPTAYVNGSYQSIYSSRQYYTQKALLDGTTRYWYGYSKSKFPNLIIKTSNGYITWGENSTNNSVLWVSSSRITYGGATGFQVCETTAYSNTTTETLYFSTGEILFDAVSFLDTGTSGDSIDPTELLFKGGETIIADTMEQKDNTLFLGNIGLTRPQITSTLQESIKNGVTIAQSTRTIYATSVSTSNYVYANQLTAFDSSGKTNSVPCGGFKRGDYYRCGIQFQHKSGKWSDPIFIKDQDITNKPTVESNDATVKLPALTGTLSASLTATLLGMGYKKARAVVIFPEVQDRVTICQGVVCPTMYTNNHRTNNKDLYAQSSWFFRPVLGSSVSSINSDGSVAPTSSGTLPYTSRSMNTGNNPNWNPEKMRQVEIQGYFGNGTSDDDKFKIDRSFSTLHSPDIEFDDHLSVLDFVNAYYRSVGYVNFSNTFSDIDIQTETPTISNGGGGFQHKGFVKSGPHGIISGLFYDDYVIDDNGTKYEAYNKERSAYKWVVYAWNRTGSLNNDVNRPADAGTRTAVLKKKVISNLRYTTTTLEDLGNASSTTTPQVFNSDQLSIVKVGENIYQGNVDTLLSPNGTDGMYFAFNSTTPTESNVSTPFTSTIWWKTFNRKDDSEDGAGMWKWNASSSIWERQGGKTIGDNNATLAVQREHVRMRYKSTPHLVLSVSSSASASASASVLPIMEIVRKGDTDSSFYRGTMFGGITEDALKSNIWIPCGEPVTLGSSYDETSTSGATKIQYSYGDTYYQRWDCLKTYPFTPEDINQIVEIGSFLLETRVNIDGRYDRNRGQSSNLNMTPQNFNLLNPVYTQVNNFFTYRILEEAYYNISSFPNQITWTKEKQAGADVDAWTNITLASTYDMDGSKGAVVSLNTWKDQIYCFQDKGISNILFNSRVQIPTSDGVPIEISNSYKVDGYRYISDGVGCINKWTISDTPSGLYFIDSISNHLYYIGEGIQDISTVHNMTSWFNNIEENEVVSTLYDNVNHDLYLMYPAKYDSNGSLKTTGGALCYSEILGQFTSFMDYDRVALLESNGNYVYTMRDSELYYMFLGDYCNFFGTYKGWDFTFVSNGVDNSTMDFDKIFSTMDYRMDMFYGNNYMPDKTLDYIQVTNEYQDTGQVSLARLKTASNVKSYHRKGTNLQKKFRIWRIQVPRNKNSLDRMRNPWCKIKLGKNSETNLKAVLHDLNVQYFI